MSRFAKVDEQVPMWSPRMKGKKGDASNPITALEPGPNSWIIGWYLGKRSFEAKESRDTFTVHKIKAYEIGDPSMVESEITKEGVNIEFFGTGVLNRILEENIQPGQPIRVMWLGIVPKSDKVKRSYHNWTVDVDTEAEVIQVMNGVVISDSQSSNNEIPKGAAIENNIDPSTGMEAAGVEAGEDDDLPF
jgi:hypothetical protein